MHIACPSQSRRPVRVAPPRRTRDALVRGWLLLSAALTAHAVPAPGAAQAPASESTARGAALAGRVTGVETAITALQTELAFLKRRFAEVQELAPNERFLVGS